MKITTLIISTFLLLGCATVKVEPPSPQYATHPVEPEWTQFSRAPVIGEVERDGNKNFEISD